MFDVFDRMVDYERGRHYTVDHVTGEVYAVPFCVHCESGGSSPPPPTPEEIELMKLNLEEAKWQKSMREQIVPYVLQQAGYKYDDSGKIVKMPEDERLASMTEDQRQQYELAKLASEQAMKALKGELPLSQAVEQEIAKQRGDLETYMASKLGPNWRQSTPGIQALAEFESKANALREDYMHGRQASLSSIGLSERQGLSSLLGQQAGTMQMPFSLSGGVMGSVSQAMQPYQLQRQMEFQAGMANANRGSALWGGLGSLLGTGLMAGASYFGGPAAAAALLAANNMRGSGPSAYGGFAP